MHRGPRPRNTNMIPNSSSSPSNSNYDDEIGLTLTDQRENVLDEIEHSAKHLKALAHGISRETDRRNRLIDQLQNNFDQSDNLFASTMGSLNRMIQNGGTTNSCMVAVFIVVVVLILYFIYSYASTDPVPLDEPTFLSS